MCAYIFISASTELTLTIVESSLQEDLRQMNYSGAVSAALPLAWPGTVTSTMVLYGRCKPYASLA